MKMKILYSLMARAVMLCMISTSAISQSAVQFGIKGGINYSRLGLDNAENEKSKTGYHIGGFVTLNLLEHLALQPEVLYSTKGADVEFDDIILNGSSTLNLDYVDVPLMLIFRLNKNINIHAGPYVSVLVNADADSNNGDELFDFEKEIGNNNFKATDWGLSGGVGLDLSFLHAGVRYSRGLEKVDESRMLNGIPYQFSNATNSVFQIYAGIHF